MLHLLLQMLIYLLVHPAVVQRSVRTRRADPVMRRQVPQRVVVQLREVRSGDLQRIDKIVSNRLPPVFLRVTIQKLQVEADDIVPHEDGIPRKTEEVRKGLLKARAACHHIIRDPVHGARIERDRHPGIYQRRKFLRDDPTGDLHRRDLHHLIRPARGPRRLQVKEHIVLHGAADSFSCPL